MCKSQSLCRILIIKFLPLKQWCGQEADGCGFAHEDCSVVHAQEGGADLDVLAVYVQIPLVLASSKPGFRSGYRPGFEQKKSLKPGFRLVCDQTPTFNSGRVINNDVGLRPSVRPPVCLSH